MKATLNIVGVLFVILGAIWFLQGINVLPGSFAGSQMVRRRNNPRWPRHRNRGIGRK
jgi:hypothetical protein